VIPEATQLPPSPTAEELLLMGTVVFDCTLAAASTTFAISEGSAGAAGAMEPSTSFNRTSVKVKEDWQQDPLRVDGLRKSSEKHTAIPSMSRSSPAGGDSSSRREVKLAAVPLTARCRQAEPRLGDSFPSASGQVRGFVAWHTVALLPSAYNMKSQKQKR
jgi:hypothetical protein